MTTYKLQLTEEQWAEAVKAPTALLNHLVEQQPDLGNRLAKQLADQAEKKPAKAAPKAPEAKAAQ